ncbi:hypothetical protein [Actinomadura rudentiformis]|uniref:Uncharacterized protein n=1 Tax=Actinomadura rudentiformis TaxID=359158 RepID=A0A6H9Z198_9ACTN|nr:hypothetical protein [Actinomadura rudentiformis]KAB2347844.1 hypothetical protein F8566_18295 [Actinomadura rudentiformis]
MITGYDSVLLSTSPPGNAVATFVRGLSQRWPALRIALDESEFVKWDPAIALPDERAEILLAQDEQMVERWEDEGYYLSRSGEGPLMVVYEPCPSSRLKILLLDDPYGRTGFAFEPYEVALTGPGLSLVTIVTPDSDSEFSKQAIAELTTALQA